MVEHIKKIDITKRIAKIVDTALLIIHILFMLFFMIMNIDFMVVANAFSVSVYLIMLKMSQERLERFVLVTYYEVLVHMILAVVCVGWEFGFQFYSFALIPVIFYYDFLSQRKRKKKYHPVMTSVLVMVLFCALIVYTWYCEPIYQVTNQNIKLFCILMNGVFIFAFLAFYMANYETLTLHRDNIASKDELTGFLNRHEMNDNIRMILENHSSDTISIAIADIDDFKIVNDTYGHSVGDMVLKSVAKAIENIQDEHCFVSRWGGEEFLIVSYGEKSYGELKEKLQMLIDDIPTKSIIYNDTEIAVTLTAGVVCKIPEETIEETISRADALLYQGKTSGKNKVVAEM